MSSPSPRFVPVIELEPFVFTDRPVDPSELASSEARDALFRRVFGEAGLALDPIVEGSFHVFAEAIATPEALRVVLDQRGIPALGGELLEQDPDLASVTTLPGGLALYDGPRLLWLPGCCGSLADIDVWRACLFELGSQWLTHGTLTTARLTDDLEITWTNEYAKAPSLRFVAPAALLRAALADAERALDALAERYARILAPGLGDHRDRVARRLIDARI